MGRRFLVGGNWKANPKTIEEAKKLIDTLNGAKINATNVEVVVAAPFIFLPLLKDHLRKDWAVSAENIYTKDNGAYTGEVTAPMLNSFGIGWTILGHSERRDLLHESDEFLAEKLTQAINHGLHVIFCCGEHLEERQAGKQNEFVSAQIEKMNQYGQLELERLLQHKMPKIWERSSAIFLLLRLIQKLLNRLVSFMVVQLNQITAMISLHNQMLTDSLLVVLHFQLDSSTLSTQLHIASKKEI